MKNRLGLGIIVSLIVGIGVLYRALCYSDVQDSMEKLNNVEVILTGVNQKEGSQDALLEGEFLSFDLGEMTLEDETHVINIPLTGRLTVPQEEGDHPIVFILPDLTVESNLSKAYEGILAQMSQFNYLGIYLDLKPLKQIEGFREEMLLAIFNEYRERLSRSLVGEGSELEVDLTNKGTLSKVVMVSHGQSTKMLYDIALDQEYKQQLNLEGILLIDPSDSNDLEFSYPDVPTAMIISEENQDEYFIGHSLYEDYRKEKARKSLTSLVYVKSGKLDDFNYTGLESALTFDRNIEFVSRYVVDFLQSIFYNQSTGSGLSVLELAPQTLYETTVRTSLTVPNTMMLMNAAIEKNPTVNLLGGKMTTHELEIESMNEDVPSFLMHWYNENASIEIELPTGHRDLSHYDAISLYLSNVNEQEEISSPSFTIELVDENNEAYQVEVHSIEYLLVAGVNESMLYNERVLLNEFEKIDLKAIQKVKLLFDQTTSGAIRLGDLSFVRSPKES